MNVLITGSSGQVGTNLGLRLLDEGHGVFGIDRRKNTWTNRIPEATCDLLQPITLELPWKPDVVSHFAAHAKVHELVENPHRAFENIHMEHHVLEFCRRYGIPILFSSSREVYGNVRREKTREIDVDIHTCASSYAASKIAGEAMIHGYSNSYGLPFTILRFSNVYGRFDNDLGRMERVIPKFIKKISEAEPIAVYGSDKKLDFTYIDDCINGVCLALQKLVSGKVQNETFNIAYGQGHSLLELVAYIEGATGRKAEIDIRPSQPGEVTHYVADISKARRMLGYDPKVPLQKGIARVIADQTVS